MKYPEKNIKKNKRQLHHSADYCKMEDSIKLFPFSMNEFMEDVVVVAR